MEQKFAGAVHKYGDHIDTDIIIPARVLNDPRPENLAAHCMEDLDPGFVQRVQPGDLLVAGLNFGCGSSREHAPMALKAVGIRCVIAENFARIFYRNAINIGLPLLECPEAARDAAAGDLLEVDLERGTIYNRSRRQHYQALPFPAFMQQIIAAGGLIAHTRHKLGKQ